MGGLLFSFPLGPITSRVSEAVYFFPSFLLLAVPSVLVLRRLFRHAGRPRWTWLESTVTGLAALLFLISETGELACIWGATWPQRAYLGETMAELSMLAAIGLGFLIVRRLGPAWSRRVGPVYTES